MRSWWKSLSRNQKIAVAGGVAVPLVIGLFSAGPSYVELFKNSYLNYNRQDTFSDLSVRS
jgi:flagellar biosynthesis/type III secretory pathway M-ring protein FliF/YscJ